MVNYLIRRMNRELAKTKFRAIGSAALIALAVAAYISFSAMTPSASRSLEEMVEEQNISDLIVHVGLANATDVARVSAIDGVEVVDSRITVSSRFVYEGPDGPEAVPATLVGIEPDSSPPVNTLRVSDGSFFSSSPAGEALVEGGFALNRGILPDDVVEVQLPSGYVSLSVQGLVYSPEHILIPMNPQSVMPVMGSLAIVYVPIDTLRAAFAFPDDYVNEVLALFDGTVPTEDVILSVTDSLASNVITYSQGREELYGYALVKEDIKQGESFAGVIAFLILLAAFFVIYSFFSRVVDEQRKQIGVMRALGYSRRAVLMSYLYMASVVGFSGSILGILAGVPFGKYLANFYVEMMFPSDATELIMNADVLLAGLMFGPITAALACAVAVWSTVSLEPHEAIKDMRTQKMGRSWLRKRLGHRSPRSSYIMVYTMRNLFRHRKRTFFTVVAVAFSIVLAALSFLMIASFSHSVEKSITDNEHWDVVVDYAYPLNHSSAAAIDVDGVTETVQVARLVATWTVGSDSGQVIVTALPQDQDLHIVQIIEGAVASASDEVMVAYAMSNDYGISVGDTMALDSGSGLVELTVSGIHADSIGQVVVYMETAESLVPEPALVGMFVRCDDGSVGDVASTFALMPIIANVQYRSDVQNGLLDFMTGYNGILYAFSMVGVTISTLTVANVVFMGVLERQREYGQLRAIGYSRRDMSKSIVGEILVVIGLGAVVGVPLLWLMLEAFVGTFREFWPMYQTILYLGDWLEYFIVLGMVVAFGLLAALPGIRYVNRMDIAKAVTGGRFG